MKRLIFIIGVLMVTASRGQSLRQLLMRADSDLKDVCIIPCKASPELFIAILVTENHWWETISFVRYYNRKIVWQATIDSLPTSQSINAARQIFLKGFQDPLFEVYDMTHMGNGFYYLYRLHGRKAQLMLSTRAVDRNMDESEQVRNNSGCSLVFKNDSLTPSYKDLNHDGYADIRLTGVGQLYARDEKTLLRQWRIQKVFLYNRRQHRFIEDRRRRIGTAIGNWTD